MAYAIDTYTGNGSTTTFSVTFPYIEKAHVVVTVDGTTKTLTTDYTFPTSSTIQFVSAPAASTTIKFTRSSNRTARLTDYQDGSTLTEATLDQDGNQTFYMAQEAIDVTENTLNLDASDLWDATSKRIINVATPTGTNDAATKAYVDTVAGSATAAAASEANALTYKNAAETAKTAAEAALDTFDDDYLGSKSSDPSVDNDGDALADGSLYFNTTDNRMKVYDLGTTTWNYVSPTASDQTKINTVSDNITAVSNVSTNLSGVNSFNDRYRVSSSAPASSLDVGDLYFDTTANELKVYKSSGWAAAGSTVNGTAQRYTYNITGTPNSVSGADAKGDTLAYDAGFVDVYLNGVRLSNSSGSYTGDVTVSSGNSVVFANNLAAGDVVDVVAYGTFSAASIAASSITSGTLNLDRIPSITNAKLDGSIANDKLANNSITINGSAVALGGSVTVGETKPTATSCTPSTITNDATNVVIAGTNFTSIPQVWALNTSTGIWYLANSVSYTSATSITANFTLTVDAQYKIRVENPDGNATLSGTNILTVSDAPTWSTSAGSLGTVAGNFSGTVSTLSASSDSAITYSETTNVLTNASQANCALNSSTGAITTSDFGGSSTTPTTYNFTIRATDAENQTTDRTFSLSSTFGSTGGGQFN